MEVVNREQQCTTHLPKHPRGPSLNAFQAFVCIWLISETVWIKCFWFAASISNSLNNLACHAGIPAKLQDRQAEKNRSCIVSRCQQCEYIVTDNLIKFSQFLPELNHVDQQVGWTTYLVWIVHSLNQHYINSAWITYMECLKLRLVKVYATLGMGA